MDMKICIQCAELDPTTPCLLDSRGQHHLVDAPKFIVETFQKVKGALDAQDRRIQDAGLRVGLFFGTDTPERMADEIEALREFRAIAGRLISIPFNGGSYEEFEKVYDELKEAYARGS